MAKAASRDTSNTCSRSPVTNASNNVVGMTLSRNGTILIHAPSARVAFANQDRAWLDRCQTLRPVSAGSPRRARSPTPGSRPPRNRSSVFTPTRPSFFMSLIEATPCTTVQKMIGAIIILIELDEPVTEGLQSLTVSRRNPTDQNAHHDCHQHLHIEVAIPRSGRRLGETVVYYSPILEDTVLVERAKLPAWASKRNALRRNGSLHLSMAQPRWCRPPRLFLETPRGERQSPVHDPRMTAC